MKRAAVTVGLIAALCYAAGFIEGYELGQRVALLPPFCAMETIGN